MKYSSHAIAFKPLQSVGLAMVIIGMSLSGCTSIKNILNQGDPHEEAIAQPVAAEEAQRQFAKAAQAMDQQNYELALQILRDLQQQYPSLSGPWLNEGIILAQQNQCGQAIFVLQKTVRINPQSKYAYNQLGLCFRTQGKFQQAKEAYLNALNLDPSYKIAIYNLAILEELYLQDLAAALDHFRLYQSLQAEPERRVKGWIKDLERRLARQAEQALAEPEQGQDTSQKRKEPKLSSDTSEVKAAVSTIEPTQPKVTTELKPTSRSTTTPTATLPVDSPSTITATPSHTPKPVSSPKSSNFDSENSVFSEDFTLELEPEPESESKQEKPTRSSIWR